MLNDRGQNIIQTPVTVLFYVCNNLHIWQIYGKKYYVYTFDNSFFCGGVKVPGIPDLEIKDFEPNFHA